MTISRDDNKGFDPGCPYNRDAIQSPIDQKSADNNSSGEAMLKSKPEDDCISIFNELKNLSTYESVGICEGILLNLGFKRVNITAISKGAYLEGDCIFEKNPFLWLKTLFRLDRNENSIDSRAVRGFRTAMRGCADKGIFMTTNTFTMDAKWEAAREGVLPIMLVDRYKLIKMINKL